MKKLLLFTFLIISTFGFSQEDAWIFFNAKPASQPFFDNPLMILSQRSLDRRALQNIPLDEKDLPIAQAFLDEVQNANGIMVLAKSKWLNAVHVRGSVIDINALLPFTFVDHIEFANHSLNPSGRKNSKTKPYTGKKLDVNVTFDYGNSANQIQMLNGDLLHQQNFTGLGKIIAVMDAGFPGVDTAEPFARLRDNNQILGGYNYVSSNTDIYSANSHGTLVLSSMGGFTPGQLVGTAPDASYYLFVTEAPYENPVEETFWVEAAEAADSLGVDIITTSLGYTEYDNPSYSYTYADMNGITSFIARGLQVAHSRGMICVVSAGNSGNDDWHYISTPADAADALAVAAVTPQGVHASFSSYGPSSDGRIKPDVAAQGVNAVLSNPNGDIVTASGTSFSGPIIAGMTATLWSALPNLTNSQIVFLIKESSSQYNNPDDLLGYGIPNFQLALVNGNLQVVASKRSRFLVYPNPFSSTVNVMFPDSVETAKLEIYNIAGQVLNASNLLREKNSVDVSNLSSGIYLYKITNGSNVETGKLIRR